MIPYGGKNFNSIISGNDERGLCCHRGISAVHNKGNITFKVYKGR